MSQQLRADFLLCYKQHFLNNFLFLKEVLAVTPDSPLRQAFSEIIECKLVSEG